MKTFIVLATICLVYGIKSADVKTVDKVSVVDVHKPGHLSHQVVQHVVQHTVDAINHQGHLKPTVKVQHIGNQATDPAKLSMEIPSPVQQIVTQVTQHIPDVINQHVAKQRLVRSLYHRGLNSIVTQQQYHIGQHQLAAEGPQKCDYKCTGHDMTVCAFNGRCYREFDSQCSLSKHNCLNVHKTFRMVNDALCQDTTTTKCYQGDM